MHWLRKNSFRGRGQHLWLPQGTSLPDPAHPGSPKDTTKPFHPTFICTDTSKYHRNTQYIKAESTYNSDEESDKHTTSVISRPAGQLLFSSLHPFLNSPEALQSGTDPQCYTNRTEQEANANLDIYFLSLPAAPHPHSQQIQKLRGRGKWGRGGAGKLLAHAGPGLAIQSSKTLVLIKPGGLCPWEDQRW